MGAIKLEDLEEEWAKDCKIDITEPSRELAKIPSLHSKYSKYFNYHTLKTKSLTAKYKTLEKMKTDYYSGDLNNPEDLAHYGLEPFPKKVLRGDVSKWVMSDQEIIDLSLMIELHSQIANFAESIIREIRSRTYQLRAIIDWEKFVGGGA